jgi:hypothetical protein
MSRLLLLKAHITGHSRHLASGKVVTVAPHEDARPAGDIIPPGWVDGKHTAGSREYIRPIPADHPLANSRRKYLRIYHWKDSGRADLMHATGYVAQHESLDDALASADRAYFRPR